MRKIIFKKVLFIIVGLVLAGLSGTAKADLSKEQIYPLFSQGNEAFRQGNVAKDDPSREKLYEKAILSFEKIIQDGQIENSGLYYNLGNAYLLQGDVGRAILNYRRGQRLDSSDANIQKNLAFARGRRIDDVKIKTEKRVLQTLFFWHYDLSMKSKFLLGCIFFAGLCIGLTVIVWAGRNTAVLAVVVIVGILAVCFVGSVVVESNMQASLVSGVITADEIVARQGDGQNYPASFKGPLHSGTEFDLIEDRGGWLHIKLADESDGWIPQTSADVI